MKQIIFVTGNPYKVQIAQKVLEGSGIELVQQKIETPEIQDMDVCKIASYSAKWAAEELQKPVALTDAGYYITVLNGFPGPFIKFINKWLSSEELIKLMEGKTNREVVVKGCLGYCEPGKEPMIFTSEVKGMISDHPVKTDKQGNTSINEIFIPNGFDKVESEIPREEMVKFWSGVETYWLRLMEYLSENN